MGMQLEATLRKVLENEGTHQFGKGLKLVKMEAIKTTGILRYTFGEGILVTVPFATANRIFNLKAQSGAELPVPRRESKGSGTKTNKGKMATSEAVVTICYGKKDTWASRDLAMQHFFECMTLSEGSERSRYTNVYMKLKNGMKVCDDSDIC